MKRTLFAVALFVLVTTAASAHRLDEYLQGTIFSVTKGHVTADLTLTPGVAIFPTLIPDIDTNRWLRRGIRETGMALSSE